MLKCSFVSYFITETFIQITEGFVHSIVLWTKTYIPESVLVKKKYLRQKI